MKMKILVLLIVTWTVLGLTDAQSPATELKLIQVTFRHGHRAPSYRARASYPLDPYVNLTWYPEGWNGLNNHGKRSAYELGAFLREKYGQWIGDVYLEDNIQFRSSDHSRVVMSTQLVAAGLFPPSEVQRWNPELNWQPIPIHFLPDQLHRLIYRCSKYKAMKRELEERDDFLFNRTEELTEFFEFVSTNVGTNVGQVEMIDIYNQLNSEASQGLELPQWTQGIFPEGKLEEVAAYGYVIQSYNKSMIQMNGGPWIHEWLKNVDRFLNGPKSGDGKGFFYGAHDSNIASILMALGVFQPHIPFYSSAIIFELSGAGDELYVKVLYRNRGRLQELLVPGCGSMNCPLATFRQLFADIIVEDPIALCQNV